MSRVPAEALNDLGILAAAPLVEFQAAAAVARLGGVAVLPWRSAALAATAAGVATVVTGDGLSAGAWTQAVVHLQKGREATLADCAAAWRSLADGGRLLVCGGNDLGITTWTRRLAAALNQEPQVLANRGHGRVVAFTRRQHDWPLPAATARRVALWPGQSDDPGLDLEPGVFSSDAIDPGTRLLLDELADQAPPSVLLDLGCGAGALAIATLLRAPAARAVLADADARAVACARGNLARLGLADRAEVQWWDAGEPSPAAGCDLVVINPPFHAGTAVDLAPSRGMFRAAAQALVPGGWLLAVANRRLPYERELAALGKVTLRRQEDGFKVLAVERER